MTTVESSAATSTRPTGHPMGADFNWLLHRVGGGLANVLDEVARRHDSSLRAYVVLTAIATCPPTTQLALGDQLGVDKTAVTAVLDFLEAQGWIERRPAPNDRRARVALATKAGRSWLERVRPEMEIAEAGLFVDISADELAVLRNVLQRLALGRFAAVAPPAGSCV